MLQQREGVLGGFILYKNTEERRPFSNLGIRTVFDVGDGLAIA